MKLDKTELIDLTYKVNLLLQTFQLCRLASIFSMVIFYLLCFAIIISNVTVLLVVRFDPYFHSPYGYFKASIALADLFVGKKCLKAFVCK